MHQTFFYIQFTFGVANLSLSLSLRPSFLIARFLIINITRRDIRERKCENDRCSRREIGRNFGGVHNRAKLHRRKMVDTRAGRLQGLRAPPQINISFQPRQPPTATRPSSPSSFAASLATSRLSILHPVVFSLVSPRYPYVSLIRSLSRSLISLFFSLLASSPDDSVIAQNRIVLFTREILNYDR